MPWPKDTFPSLGHLGLSLYEGNACLAQALPLCGGKNSHPLNFYAMEHDWHVWKRNREHGKRLWHLDWWPRWYKTSANQLHAPFPRQDHEIREAQKPSSHFSSLASQCFKWCLWHRWKPAPQSLVVQSKKGDSGYTKCESNGCYDFVLASSCQIRWNCCLPAPMSTFEIVAFYKIGGLSEVIWRRKWRALTHINQEAAWKDALRQDWERRTKGTVMADHQGQERTQQK